jgi:hypothetical protein
VSLFGGLRGEQTAVYDTVVSLADGAERRLTRAEFEKLTLVDRVRLLAGGDIRFFRGAAEVDKSIALARR